MIQLFCKCLDNFARCPHKVLNIRSSSDKIVIPQGVLVATMGCFAWKLTNSGPALRCLLEGGQQGRLYSFTTYRPMGRIGSANKWFLVAGGLRVDWNAETAHIEKEYYFTIFDRVCPFFKIIGRNVTIVATTRPASRPVKCSSLLHVKMCASTLHDGGDEKISCMEGSGSTL